MRELEKQFFETFEIEPDVTSCYGKCSHKFNTESYLNCKNCDKATVIYPQITDRHYLELISICNNAYVNGYSYYFTSVGRTVEEVKKEILKKCRYLQDEIKHQVQELFKER